MVVRVGINGFGRIGRVIFRTCMQNKDLEVTAINDPAVDIEYICYLIKFDSTHGKFKSDVAFSANEITIDDKKIKVFSEKLPSSIPWKSAGVQYVVEASGMFTSRDKAWGHLASDGVKRVIVTAPTVDIPMLILGVNNEQINAEHKVVSCASSTLYCLAPIVKILEDSYGVAEGCVTSIHAMTPSLKPLDGLCLKGKHWRDHRSIHQNIIPAATGACRALGKIIPQVKDKLTGMAFRVPIVNVSVLDISVRLSKSTSIQDIMKRVETESKSNMKNIIKISKDQEVSSDFLGDENSCIFDVNSSLELNPKFYKIICWYENEYSYACRVVDLIKYSEENHFKLKEIMHKLSFDRVIAAKGPVCRKPIPYFNKDYVSCNCYIQNNPVILLSTSQDTGLKVMSPQRQMSLPFQSSRSNQPPLHKTNKSNEMFNVWDDEAQISTSQVTENRNVKLYSFQSCMALGPPNKLSRNYLTTQKRLEELKKEFSKMVNMTEKLLKKTSESKCEINILETHLTDNKFDNTQSVGLMPGVRKTIALNKEVKASVSRIYEGVFKTQASSEGKETSRKDERKRLNQQMDIKRDGGLLVGSIYTLLDKDRQNKVIIKEKVKNSKVSKHNVDLENKMYLKQNLCATTNCNIQTKLNDSYIDKRDPNVLNLGTKKLIAKLIENNKSNLENSSDSKKVNFIEEPTEDENNKYSGSNEMHNEITNTEKAQITQTRSPSLVNTNTTLSGEIRRNLDLYDKLDSVSATDSENSFQIHERKSHVIDLSDINSSADDLNSLDKICKIIEISDELSDRLFSALDDNDAVVKKKKWSFKDLCERLKLDDFCNDVFGQSMR